MQDRPSAIYHADVKSAYARWAPIYDLVFTTAMKPGRRAGAAAINALAQTHDIHLLDVGVGTGLELPMFSPTVKITGIDLSEPMLNVARKRVLRLPAWLLVGVVRALAAFRLPTPVEPGVLDFAVLYWYVNSGKAAAALDAERRVQLDARSVDRVELGVGVGAGALASEAHGCTSRV